MLTSIDREHEAATCYGEIWGGGNKKHYGIWLNFSIKGIIKEHRKE
jgi:hypothetical protein